MNIQRSTFNAQLRTPALSGPLSRLTDTRNLNTNPDIVSWSIGEEIRRGVNAPAFGTTSVKLVNVAPFIAVPSSAHRSRTPVDGRPRRLAVWPSTASAYVLAI